MLSYLFGGVLGVGDRVVNQLYRVGNPGRLGSRVNWEIVDDLELSLEVVPQVKDFRKSKLHDESVIQDEQNVKLVSAKHSNQPREAVNILTLTRRHEPPLFGELEVGVLVRINRVPLVAHPQDRETILTCRVKALDNVSAYRGKTCRNGWRIRPKNNFFLHYQLLFNVPLAHGSFFLVSAPGPPPHISEYRAKLYLNANSFFR